MKNIINKTLGAGAFLVAGAMLASCNDYLNIEPPSSVSPETYFTTAEQLGAYTINYYAQGGMNGNRDANAFPHFGNSGSGYQFYLKSGDEGTDNEMGGSASDSYYIGNSYKVGQGTGGSWGFYTINELNYFLTTAKPKYLAGQVGGDQIAAAHYVGEAHLLLAIEYYKKLRNMGDFPIITECLPLDKEVLMEASKRRPRNEVARFILAQLDSAIYYLSDGATTGGKNRATKEIAYLEKARVALYEATFEMNFAGTPFVPDANAGWPGAQKDYLKDYSYNNQAEVDFFVNQAIEASEYVIKRHPNLTNNNKQMIGASYEKLPANPYYDMWVSDDLSGVDEVLMWRNYLTGTITHTMNQYMKGVTGYTQEYANCFLMENGLPIYDPNSGYKGDDWVQDTKEGRDWRWRLFMKAPNEYVYEGVKDQRIGAPLKRNSATLDVPAIKGGSGINFTSTTGYHKGKGLTKNVDYTVIGQDATAAICYRSVEAYLIYIEAAYYKFGPGLNADAWTYWNKIRTRAGVADAQTTIAATDLDKEEALTNDFALYTGKTKVDKVLYNIRRERRCELISEGFRWDDLKRWRCFDRLVDNKVYLHGAKMFGPMNSKFPADHLIYNDADYTKNNVSKPDDPYAAINGVTGYIVPFRVSPDNKFYETGLRWKMAHYLEPINYGHFIESAPDGVTASTSNIYQNPYWPVEGDVPAIQ